MRKFISAVTSLAMAATMASAVAPVVTSAAGKDTAKGFAIKTYAESDSKYASAGSKVTVSAEDIAAGDVTIPCAVYLNENKPDTTSLNINFAVSGGAGAGDIVFKAYARTDSYFSTPKEYTLADGSKFTTDIPVFWGGKYDPDYEEFLAAGTDNIACTKGQESAKTENYFYGMGWTNGGEAYNWSGNTATDYPFTIFDVTLPKGLAAGEYTIEFLTHNTNSIFYDEVTGELIYNPATIIQSGSTRYQTNLGNLTLENMIISVEGDVDPTTTTTTTTTTTSSSTTTTTTTTQPGPKPDAEV
ncbi:MAG: hypothetical protein NC247_05605, partial [Ruminococcus flavefaciens]|nr:hypothetical protein [Ruminococcus flavefaciens]MCM1360292.1 hypothetical protein [Clostridiales bacterium]MCM1435521.1 hypothetical protein [Ruminococcus flavefaciens]